MSRAAARALQIQAAIDHLKLADPVLGSHIERVGPYTLKQHRNRYEMLVRSIISQQISTKAARSVRLRLQAATPSGRITPEDLAAMSEESLRAVGLSGQKTRYLKGLTDAVLSGTLQLDRIGRLSDEDVIAHLIQVKGIGVWTAQMFLMFALGRLDVFPHGDLGLRSSIGQLYGFSQMPDPATCQKIAEIWRPYSTVASWYVWRVSDLKNDPTADASVYPV